MQSENHLDLPEAKGPRERPFVLVLLAFSFPKARCVPRDGSSSQIQPHWLVLSWLGSVHRDRLVAAQSLPALEHIPHQRLDCNLPAGSRCRVYQNPAPSRSSCRDPRCFCWASLPFRGFNSAWAYCRCSAARCSHRCILRGLLLPSSSAKTGTDPSPLRPLAFILLAACLAAAVSVGLQLFQWLGLTADSGLMDILGRWKWGRTSPLRQPGATQPVGLPAAVGGLLGCLLAWHQRWIGAAVAMVLAAFVLLGVALTSPGPPCSP